MPGSCCQNGMYNQCCEKKYEIIEYNNICESEFKVIINDCCDKIQGFILTFVDECGTPICLDPYKNNMRVQGIYEFPNCAYACNPNPCSDQFFYNELIPWNNKLFYTYTEQTQNCMPLNTALWACYLNADVPLQLSFYLEHDHPRPITMYINMFFTQEHLECNLEQVINHCICNDIYGPCVCCPYRRGYVTWMINLVEPCPPCPPHPPCPPYPPCPTPTPCLYIEEEPHQENHHSVYVQPIQPPPTMDSILGKLDAILCRLSNKLD